MLLLVLGKMSRSTYKFTLFTLGVGGEHYSSCYIEDHNTYITHL